MRPCSMLIILNASHLLLVVADLAFLKFWPIDRLDWVVGRGSTYFCYGTLSWFPSSLSSVGFEERVMGSCVPSV